jgi:hypothetical protein
MRMMLKISMPVEASNTAVKDGTLPQTIKGLLERLKPEASYFFPEDGKRTALFVFDMHDTWQIPVIAEPLFIGLNAAVTLVPVMNAEDLQKGLGQAMAAR